MLTDQLPAFARTLATALGMTHEDIAEAAGLSQSGISLLLSGKRHGRPETWDAIGRALGVAWVVSTRPLAPSETATPGCEHGNRTATSAGPWCLDCKTYVPHDPIPADQTPSIYSDSGDEPSRLIVRPRGGTKQNDGRAQCRHEVPLMNVLSVMVVPRGAEADQ